VHDNDCIGIEEADGDEALLTVVETAVRDGESRAGKYRLGIGKVKAVFDDICLALGLVPGEFHGFIIHIIMHIAMTYAIRGQYMLLSQ